MIRSIIFWTHLVCGLTTGIVVFSMSVTGVLLTYERQMEQWVRQSHYVPEELQVERKSLEDLIALQAAKDSSAVASSAVITNDPGAPISFRAGRRAGATLNPYTGEEMHVESESMSSFFGTMMRFHRWFDAEGENRAIAKQITGVSNVVFLFLVLSGMYLWLPKIYKWVMFRARLLFRSSYPNSKARDYHWHHIFGIWVALPLIAVIYSGAVISYPWAANFMYRVFGAEVPVPRGAPSGPANGRENNGTNLSGAVAATTNFSGVYLPLDQLVELALADSGEGWERLTLSLPDSTAQQVNLEIDKGNGAQAHLRHSLTLDRSTGEILASTGYTDIPKAQRLRTIARFLHTGEVLGFWGQTIAGLASLAALFLVWTGFALSWRRLIQPLLRKSPQ